MELRKRKATAPHQPLILQILSEFLSSTLIIYITLI